ncbi:MAG TPA: glycosyltransferase [Chitinophagaceae bacterium]|nr:glycosyltransferase [Chitinophagaceae bacterium]
MRILFIHNQYQQAGGEDVAVAMEAGLLKVNGHEVRTIIFQNINPTSGFDKLIKAGQAIYNPSAYRQVKKEIDDFGPDLIHVHNLFYVASPAVLFAASRLKIPVILTLHNYRLVCANALLLRDGRTCELCVNKTVPLSGIRYRCYHHSMAESAVVTAMSSIHKIIGTWKQKISLFILLTEFAKSKFAASSLKVSPNRLVVKPNFIPDPGVSSEVEREEFFLFVGRLSPEKGIENLLQAFAALPRQRLVIIGEGPEGPSAKARYLGATNITFMGKMEKEIVLSHMKRCRALVFPSTWYEGLPFVIIEAFATGTPVIASRLGAMAELINDGYNGYHFEAGNSIDLQKKIELLLQTETEKRKRLYENARTTYLDKFHPRILYQTILSIYENVINEKG